MAKVKEEWSRVKEEWGEDDTRVECDRKKSEVKVKEELIESEKVVCERRSGLNVTEERSKMKE